MANVIDGLFDSILSKLGSVQELDWPQADIDAGSENIPDDLPELEDADISPIDEIEVARRVGRRLTGSSAASELNDDENEAVEGSIRSRGFETLAFYKSRRLIASKPFPGRWGIFYIKQGLTYVETQLRSVYPGYGSPQTLALQFLREHERFHFFADVQTLLFEATLGRHLYLPLHRALSGLRSHFAEEALANRQVWDWSKKGVIGIEEFAKDFMLLQPNAYARFREPKLKLAAEWAATVVDQKPPGSAVRKDLAHWVEATPIGFRRASLCPQYVVFPNKLSSWISPALVLPPVKEVQDGKDVERVLRGRFAHLRSRWEQTKSKLLENRLLHGLNFKPWPKDGPERYSVRVDDNFRAHLKHLGAGHWDAYVLGPHKALGHG